MNAGRKRSFDTDVALDKAMKVFWLNGYSGTSLSDLTEEMNINKPSLYAAFGNKEALFITIITRYLEQHASESFGALFAENQSLAERMKNFFTNVVKLVTDPEMPGGCLMCMSIAEAKGESLPPQAIEVLDQAYQETEQKIVDFFSHEQTLGNIEKQTPPSVLAGSLMSLQLGLASMGRRGSKPAELNSIVDHSLLSFDFL